MMNKYIKNKYEIMYGKHSLEVFYSFIYLLLGTRCLSLQGQPVWTAAGLVQMHPFFAKQSPKKRRVGPPAQLYQHQPKTVKQFLHTCELTYWVVVFILLK